MYQKLLLTSFGENFTVICHDGSNITSLLCTQLNHFSNLILVFFQASAVWLLCIKHCVLEFQQSDIRCGTITSTNGTPILEQKL